MKEQELTEAHGMYSPLNKDKGALKKRLLTVQEAADYLGRSVPAVRELQWAGSLPYIQVGRRIHFDIYDLDKWIDQHKARHAY